MHENARELLTLELERYNTLLYKTWEVAIGEEAVMGFSRKDAAKLCLDIMKQRDKLAGLETVLTVQHLHRFSAEDLNKMRDKRWDKIEERVVFVLTTDESSEAEVVEAEFADVPATTE